MSSGDFDIFRSLWENINDVCSPPPPPNVPAKSCFLMEMPGFTVDPDAFDPSKFTPTKRHPDLTTANLCDRVPAFAPYFYDTGNHISFFWKQLLQTFQMKPDPPGEDESLKEQYEAALEMLYGGKEGYVKLEKTPLYSNVDVLRKTWEKKKQEEAEFRSKCQEDTENWPSNFETGASPYRQAVEQAYGEYNNLKLQIERYEAAIYAYASGDLTTMMQEQAIQMAQQERIDPGGDGSAFYNTVLEPADWWRWFQDDQASDEGWTEITIQQEHKYESSRETYNSFSAEATVSASIIPGFGGLFHSGSGGGGFGIQAGSSKLTQEGSKLKISFKLRKVLIHRPWFEPTILKYPTLGIKSLKSGTWSTGELNVTSNKGQFPLLPTAFVCAKDVTISADSYSEAAEKSFVEQSSNVSLKLGIGPFSIGGNFSQAHGSKESSFEYDAESKTITIKGAQIIGWVCVAIPHFPQYSPDDIQDSESAADSAADR